MQKYERVVEWIDYPVSFTCQEPAGHDGPHSWSTLKAADEKALADEATTTGMVITDLLEGIDEGEYDAYIEPLLAVLHERKRELRGRRTYPRLRRND
jgi:hypothetical protein